MDKIKLRKLLNAFWTKEARSMEFNWHIHNIELLFTYGWGHTGRLQNIASEVYSELYYSSSQEVRTLFHETISSPPKLIKYLSDNYSNWPHGWWYCNKMVWIRLTEDGKHWLELMVGKKLLINSLKE